MGAQGGAPSCQAVSGPGHRRRCRVCGSLRGFRDATDGHGDVQQVLGALSPVACTAAAATGAATGEPQSRARPLAPPVPQHAHPLPPEAPKACCYHDDAYGVPHGDQRLAGRGSSWAVVVPGAVVPGAVMVVAVD